MSLRAISRKARALKRRVGFARCRLPPCDCPRAQNAPYGKSVVVTAGSIGQLPTVDAEPIRQDLGKKRGRGDRHGQMNLLVARPVGRDLSWPNKKGPDRDQFPIEAWAQIDRLRL